MQSTRKLISAAAVVLVLAIVITVGYIVSYREPGKSINIPEAIAATPATAFGEEPGIGYVLEDRLSDSNGQPTEFSLIVPEIEDVGSTSASENSAFLSTTNNSITAINTNAVGTYGNGGNTRKTQTNGQTVTGAESRAESTGGGNAQRSTLQLPHQHSFRAEIVPATTTEKGYTLHVCDICGRSYRDTYTPVIAHIHSWVETTKILPTYKTQGYTVFRCSACGQEEYRDFTPALVCEHYLCRHTVIDPTCQEDGYTRHECMVCENYSYQDTPVAALGHEWDEGTVMTPATEEYVGVKIYFCTRTGCTASRQETIPVLEKASPHEHDYERIIVNPSCTDNGYSLFVCRGCNDSYVDTSEGSTKPAIGHLWDDGVVITEATKDQTGVVEYHCTRDGCNVTRHEQIPCIEGEPTHEHFFAYTVEIEPTCEEAGHGVYICDCGDKRDATEDEAIVPALGHEWDEGTILLPPSLTSEGIILHRCIREGCTAFFHEDIPMLESDDPNHEHNHIGTHVDATCSEAGYTTYTCECGDSYNDDLDGAEPALGHLWDDGSVLIPVTENCNGVIEYCCIRDGCHETNTEEIPSLSGSLEEQSPHEHQFTMTVVPPTCTANGFNLYTCDICGHCYIERTMDISSQAFGHNYVCVLVEATESDEGYIQHTCSHCGNSYSDCVLPAIVPMDTVDGFELDIEAVLAKAKEWLLSNGFTVDRHADQTGTPLNLSVECQQDAAEYVVLKTCQNTILHVLQECEPGKKPVFNVTSTVLGYTGFVQFNFWYSYY